MTPDHRRILVADDLPSIHDDYRKILAPAAPARPQFGDFAEFVPQLTAPAEPIVGFELEVTEWSCKLKLNQHRREAHARMREQYGAGTQDERELVAWMDRLGMEGKD